jgi:hypothetical protein
MIKKFSFQKIKNDWKWNISKKNIFENIIISAEATKVLWYSWTWIKK